MEKLIINFNNYPLTQIKNDYFLYDLCMPDTPQFENISQTIQSLYFYWDILCSTKLPRSIEASICRTIIIMSYSVIEGIVMCTGFKLQKACSYCNYSCKYGSSSMFTEFDSQSEADKKEKQSFKNANDYLIKIGIINLTPTADRFYKEFKDNRNNVHLTKGTDDIISRDYHYTMDYCKSSIEFMQNFIKCLHNNFIKHVSQLGCHIRT